MCPESSHHVRRLLRLKGSYSRRDLSFAFLCHALVFNIEVRLNFFLENGHGHGAGLAYFLPRRGARALLDYLEGSKDVVLSLLVCVLKRL